MNNSSSSIWYTCSESVVKGWLCFLFANLYSLSANNGAYLFMQFLVDMSIIHEFTLPLSAFEFALLEVHQSPTMSSVYTIK